MKYLILLVTLLMISCGELLEEETPPTTTKPPKEIDENSFCPQGIEQPYLRFIDESAMFSLSGQTETGSFLPEYLSFDLDNGSWKLKDSDDAILACGTYTQGNENAFIENDNLIAANGTLLIKEKSIQGIVREKICSWDYLFCKELPCGSRLLEVEDLYFNIACPYIKHVEIYPSSTTILSNFYDNFQM